MLVLTRKSGEAVRIGTSIKLTLLDVKGAQVKIGIEAPEDVVIYREELFSVVEAQNASAASSDIIANTDLSALWDALQQEEEV